MSDRDDKNSAWQVPPSAYLATRPANFDLPSAPVSTYITMRDGCRLAADVYVPQGVDPAKAFPALLIFTPYYRRFKTNGEVAEPAPAASRYRDFFVVRGYAVVVVDVRGTGASFGTRDALRSPTERDDYREVAEWAVRQAWSNGILGSTGVSYVGAAACFLASTGHPAVKAIAPLFGVSDIYSEQLYPGGLLSKIWTGAYDQLMLAMDHDRRDLLGKFSYYTDPGLRGPQPVDEDVDGALLKAAINEHRSNFSLHDAAPEFAFRDEGMLHDSELTLAACSPYHYLDQVSQELPIYSVSGWFDGAGYSNGAITRFLTRNNPRDRLLLGAWDHGARTNVSPWREEAAPQFNLLAELLRFFDTHLLGLESGLADEAQIHYFNIHAEEWSSASTWPPKHEPLRLELATGGLLSPVTTAPDVTSYRVDFGVSTGSQTRYERLGAAATVDYYPDWTERCASMLNFETPALSCTTPIAGHPLANLRMSIDQGDASIFVYLSEVSSDGRVHYITEGMLRAIHRETATAPDDYVTVWPFRTYHRKDATSVDKGVVTEYSISLLPVAWTLGEGSRLRLSIAGADDGHFVAMPYGRPPMFDVHVGVGGSFVVIPLLVS
ncbi:CocE/NonD family hydrolase [Paraburkholderia nemoris]|uniref:Serine esterase n=1 Tax=Paraburkholderia nemoris TaxID=2793076 RepID=A0ABN7N388_9BURK|nr:MULTISPECIES: CocE/NonD family hydrolase [Paraburkholderia]MBK3815221.1 CocE/NonD family hydrolase [Paraburkholderia aspalathi]CAE6714018.1 Putative serine esterase [Paraburkholderia nemoris]CAE6839801.1 Putative serine esterase [Paraburkholderia nemoris]